MATTDSVDRGPAAFQDAVLADRTDRVSAARRCEPATRSQQRTDEDLVGSDQSGQNENQTARNAVSSARLRQFFLDLLHQRIIP